MAALIMLAGGWLAGKVATGESTGTLVTPFTGPFVSAASVALLGAAVIGAERLLAVSERVTDSRGRRVATRSLAVVAAIMLLAGPLAGLTAWTAQNVVPQAAGEDDPQQVQPLGTRMLIAATQSRILPATAIDRGVGEEQTRTLLISTKEDGSFDATLMRGAGTTLDDLSTIAAARNIMGSRGGNGQGGRRRHSLPPYSGSHHSCCPGRGSPS
ncbi:hypothetical protein ACW0JT_22455 [Arthrobacter sp. SA17]